MRRRRFVKWLTLGGLSGLGGCSHLESICQVCTPFFKDSTVDDKAEIFSGDLAQKHNHVILDENKSGLDLKRDYFERDFHDDRIADAKQWQFVLALEKKLGQLERYVGHGNFNILSWDEMLRFSKYGAGLTTYTKEELTFLEELFYFDAKMYGFMGDKVFQELSTHEPKSSFEKVPYSGHFLKKEGALETYQKLKNDVGETLILTSGYRGLVKQFHLFLAKVVETKGNFSKASRSLAPPGYSFHGKGDFDVGKVGHGLKNFSYEFAQTTEYKRLLDLGYVGIRYSEDNLLGVRFEPWHIRV